MAIGVLVLGQSGTGKTYSCSTFAPDEVKIISVHKPILPFRGKYEVVKAPTGKDVISEMKNTDKKVIIIDDFQYILGIPMMKRIGEKGWDKYLEIEQPYSDVLEAINKLPDDVIVYINSHTETDEDGKTKIKTVGKALDKYITIEGLFMVVLTTQVIGENFYFATQNSGNDTTKSPAGMFPSRLIPNDLKYVDDHIRNYYYMDGAKSDEDIAKEDESKKVDETVGQKKPRTRNKTREEVIADNNKKLDDYVKEQQEAIEKVAGDREEVPFDEVVEATKNIEPPELEKPPRRVREEREIKPQGDSFMNEPENTEDQKPTSGRRKRRA